MDESVFLPRTRQKLEHFVVTDLIRVPFVLHGTKETRATVHNRAGNDGLRVGETRNQLKLGSARQA